MRNAKVITEFKKTVRIESKAPDASIFNKTKTNPTTDEEMLEWIKTGGTLD